VEASGIRQALARLENCLLVLGVFLLLLYFWVRVEGIVSARTELARFWQNREGSNQIGATGHSYVAEKKDIDFRLWSPKRIAAYEASFGRFAAAPVAVLKVAALDLEVPVLDGTDDLTLDRAVGHIDGTPEPGENGNIGIAGHRDGFFRALKDIHPGDAIELVTPTENISYVVDELLIVNPDDISVLRPRSKSSLTLVTCYPFYFVGSAPQRFVVHASIATPAVQRNASQEPSPAGKRGGQQND